MSYLLISNTTDKKINLNDLDFISQHIKKIVKTNINFKELSINKAYECNLPKNKVNNELLDFIIKLKTQKKLDANIIKSETIRRKKLLLADMDSTIIEGESLDDMAELAGLGAQISAITARAMRGELDFEQAIDARVGMLAGRSAQLFQTALDETKLMAGAQHLVATMRAHGAHCYLVSGGFTAIAGPIATRCGFDGYHANEMVIDGDNFTGTVVKPVLGRDAKAGFLAHYCTTHNLDADDSLCVGDGANDLGMLEAAGYGVAYHGKPLLRAAIDLQFNHSDLTGLLYLQGYHQRDFAS